MTRPFTREPGSQIDRRGLGLSIKSLTPKNGGYGAIAGLRQKDDGKPTVPRNIKSDSKLYFRDLGKRLAAVRKSRQMTQAEMARVIGVSQQAVFAYEMGDRRVSILILVRIASAFNVSLEELVALGTPLKPSKGRVSPRAIRHGERIQRLSTTQQRFVLRILNNLEDSNQDRRGV